MNVNDLKKLVSPDTTSWKLNPTVLENIMGGMEIPGDPKVVIDLKKPNPFILDSSVIFVIPDWPCCAWYKPLHNHIQTEAVELPEQHDLFLDSKGNAIGNLAWKNWLFYKAK